MSEQMSEQKDDGRLEFWAFLELFGHTKIAGYVRQVTLGGDVLLRVDVPQITARQFRWVSDDDANSRREEYETTIPPFTKFYSPKSVFAMTPVTQETAMQMMQRLQIEPVVPFAPRPASPVQRMLGREEPDETGDDDF